MGPLKEAWLGHNTQILKPKWKHQTDGSHKRLLGVQDLANKNSSQLMGPLQTTTLGIGMGYLTVLSP